MEGRANSGGRRVGQMKKKKRLEDVNATRDVIGLVTRVLPG